MIEELWDMYKRAKREAIARNESGDYRGYVEALSFAFQCKCFASELMRDCILRATLARSA